MLSKKEIFVQVFSYEFSEIFDNRVLYGAPPMAASETVIKNFQDLLII